MPVVLVIVLLFLCGVLAFLRPMWGLFVSGAVAIGLVVFALAIECAELVIVSPVPFILATAEICFLIPKDEKTRTIRIFAGRFLMTCVLVGLVVLGFILFGQWGSLGLLLLLFFGGAVFGAAATSRLDTAAAVISTIASAVRQNLPLPMALEMAATGAGESVSHTLRQIKKWLVEGYSLSESLKRGYTRCPGYVISLTAAGERIGQVRQALAAVEQDLAAKVELSRKVRPIPSLYPPLLLLYMFIVVMLLVRFVLPKYSDVLAEFSSEGARMPAATEILLAIVHFIAYGWGWVLVILLIIGLLLWAVVYVRVRSRPRRPENPYLISRLSDYIRWHLPVIHWYEWNRGMQWIVGMLRLSLNAGCTLNEAIAGALKIDVNCCFKRNLKDWLARVERGEDIGQAAGQCGLGSGLTWAFADMENHRNILQILETLESSYRWGYNRLIGLANFILGPCENVCLGAMVGFIVYAMFSPIVQIVHYVGDSFFP